MQVLNHQFQGPYNHNSGFQRDFGCVYILVNANGQLVDVGQTESVNDRLPNHDRKQCCLRNGCPDRQLYVHLSENEQYRLQLESAIRNAYAPACGIR